MPSHINNRHHPNDTEYLDTMADTITTFIADQISATDQNGAVIEISGGLNSAVVTMLAVDALGADQVFGMILPAYLSTEAEALTAELVAKGLGLEYAKVQLLPFVHLFQELSVPETDRSDDVRAMTNAIDRLRMACAYYAANTMDRLVLGTEDRTEWLLGTTTKYGVRRGDLLPLGDLYQTEVRRLADHIGIPDGLYDTPTDRRTPLTELDVDLNQPTLDAILRLLVDEDKEINQTADELDVDVETVRACAEHHVEHRHKRSLPLSPSTVNPTEYDTFHELELHFD